MDDEKQEITMEEENSENHEAYNEESEIDPTLFYEKAKSYWGSVPATVDGMLGGCSHVASTDIGGSMKFLKQFVKVIRLFNLTMKLIIFIRISQL